MLSEDESEWLHVGDRVEHKKSGLLGKVTSFAHPTTDVFVDGMGPYPQEVFRKLHVHPRMGEPGGPERETPDENGFTCSCPTFSSCTHK